VSFCVSCSEATFFCVLTLLLPKAERLRRVYLMLHAQARDPGLETKDMLRQVEEWLKQGPAATRSKSIAPSSKKVMGIPMRLGSVTKPMTRPAVPAKPALTATAAQPPEAKQVPPPLPPPPPPAAPDVKQAVAPRRVSALPTNVINPFAEPAVVPPPPEVKQPAMVRRSSSSSSAAAGTLPTTVMVEPAVAEVKLARRVSELTVPPPPAAPEVAVSPTPSAPNVRIDFAPNMICIALFDYKGPDEGDLSFKQGDKVIMKEELTTGWWTGQLERDPNSLGLFPSTYVKPFL
jgi:hypothetical protein